MPTSPSTSHPSDGPSLSHLLRERIARHARAGRIALLGRFGPMSYAGLRERIERIANAMQNVARGEIVGLLGSRSPDTVAAFLGIMQAGGCPCFLEPHPRVETVRDRLDSARARCVCLEGEHESLAPALVRAGLRPRRLSRLAPEPPARSAAEARPHPTGEPTETPGPAAGGPTETPGPAAGGPTETPGPAAGGPTETPGPAAGGPTETPGPAAGGPLGELREPLTTTDPAMVQLTSGSTGEAKAVVLTHGNLLCNARGIVARTGITAADRLLHLMPLHHTNGVNNQLIAPLLAGAAVVLADRFRAEEVEDQIAEYGVTCVTGVPTMYSRMLPHLRDPARRRSLRLLRCGSAPISTTLHERIEAAFGVPLVVSYGLSEATCTSTMNPPGARRIGSVGTVLPGQRVRLLRPGSGEAVPDGAEGEVCIAGASVMKGYLDGSTAAGLREGWLRTGDLGRFDADGYLFITGRLKDVIVRGGENLSPRAIESVLERHPSVESCCVVGGPHPDLGEVPVAFVQPRAGAGLEAGELRALVAARLSRAHAPARIHLVDTLPESAVGKVDRAALARRARDRGAGL